MTSKPVTCESATAPALPLDRIRIARITKGPNARLWQWQIDIAEVRDVSTRGWRPGVKQGIAISESVARNTAKKQLAWHLRGRA